MACLLNLEKDVSIDIVYLLYDYIYSNMFFIHLGHDLELIKLPNFHNISAAGGKWGVSVFSATG
jgi:hypothetical protein